MIPDNDRQAKQLNARIERITGSLTALESWEVLQTGISPEIIELRKQNLRRMLASLRSDFVTYASLKSGDVRKFEGASVEDLAEILKRARIAQGLTHRQFAELLGLKEQQIQRYEAESYAPVSLHRLSELFRALNISVSIHADVKKGALESEPESHTYLQDLPIKEMTRRGWIGTANGNVNERAELANKYIADHVGRNWNKFLNRQIVRSSGKVSSESLLAWQARICEVARQKEFERKSEFFSLDLSWVPELVALSRYDDGPKKAVNFLGDIGVIVVIEPHLDQTHLDGAATILDGEIPVVGMTLRHDRLDNFWFVLLHELGHLVLHSRFDDVVAFFDSEEGEGSKGKEAEADEFARTSLIADEKWKTSLVRFAKAPDAVKSFASAQGISPAIVAGRIRRERSDFRVFGELVGQGSVRRHFNL